MANSPFTLGATVRRARPPAGCNVTGTVVGYGSLAAAFPTCDLDAATGGAVVVRVDFHGIERTLTPGELEVVG